MNSRTSFFDTFNLDGVYSKMINTLFVNVVNWLFTSARFSTQKYAVNSSNNFLFLVTFSIIGWMGSKLERDLGLSRKLKEVRKSIDRSQLQAEFIQNVPKSKNIPQHRRPNFWGYFGHTPTEVEAITFQDKFSTFTGFFTTTAQQYFEVFYTKTELVLLPVSTNWKF